MEDTRRSLCQAGRNDWKSIRLNQKKFASHSSEEQMRTSMPESRMSKFSKVTGFSRQIVRETTALRNLSKSLHSSLHPQVEKASTEELDGDDTKIKSKHEKDDVSVKSGLAYKDMRNLYYYGGTIGIFYLEALIACLIHSIDDVFPPLAAIAISCLGFLFPSVFYLYAEKMFLNNRQNLIQ